MADEGKADEYAEGYDEGYEEEAMGEGPAGGEENELDAMKRKLEEMEAEANRLREAQSKGGTDVDMGGGEAGDASGKEEVDSRSIYVGNVDYGTTPEELQQLFAPCGTVNRVTILTDKFGNPKGFAYVEFLEKDAVDNAVLLDNTELRGRNIKVSPKRTNVPGMKQRGRGRRGGFRGGYGGAYGGGYYGHAPPRGRGYGYGFRGRGRGRGYVPY